MTKKEKIIEMIEEALSNFRKNVIDHQDDDAGFYLDAIDHVIENESYKKYIDPIEECISDDVYSYIFSIRIDDDKLILSVHTIDSRLFEEILN